MLQSKPGAVSGDDSDGGPEYDVDFREHPEEYDIGRGEEGVFAKINIVLRATVGIVPAHGSRFGLKH